MRKREGILCWLTVILFCCTTSAFGKVYEVGIGDDCDPGVVGGSSLYGPVCFTPAVLSINVGDSVSFYSYADSVTTGAHNVVADDGSFRCARGCDGEGGDGTPYDIFRCFPSGGCGFNPVPPGFGFTREFDVPGIVKYHDEVTGAPGVIYVGVLPPGAIGTNVTGTWFDSAQGGMGFMVEVVPGSPLQMLAAWLTFSPEGDSSWVVGLGPIAGDHATLSATQTVGSGARFPPNFDPAHVADQSWGTLTFTFSDCNHGHVDWSSTLAGYGNGGMDLTRLTLPAGLTCPAGAGAASDAGVAPQ
jgi:plastocyanin